MVQAIFRNGQYILQRPIRALLPERAQTLQRPVRALLPERAQSRAPTIKTRRRKIRGDQPGSRPTPTSTREAIIVHGMRRSLEAGGRGIEFITRKRVSRMRTIMIDLVSKIGHPVAQNMNCVAVGFVKFSKNFQNGGLGYAYTVNRNKFRRKGRGEKQTDHPLHERAEELNVIWIKTEPRVKTKGKLERAKHAAPEDAEQLFIKGAKEDPRIEDVIAVMPSQYICIFCSQIVPKQGAIMIGRLSPRAKSKKVKKNK